MAIVLWGVFIFMSMKELSVFFPDQINNYVIRYLYVEDSHVNCQLFSLYSFILVE